MTAPETHAAPHPPGPYSDIETELLRHSDVELTDEARAALIRVYNDHVGAYLQRRAEQGVDMWASDPDFRHFVTAHVHAFSYLLRTRGLGTPSASDVEAVGKEVIRGSRTRYTESLPTVRGLTLDCPLR